MEAVTQWPETKPINQTCTNNTFIFITEILSAHLQDNYKSYNKMNVKEHPLPNIKKDLIDYFNFYI